MSRACGTSSRSCATTSTAPIRDLRAKGITVEGEPEERRMGITVMLVLPGDLHVMLYEPRHPVAIRT